MCTGLHFSDLMNMMTVKHFYYLRYTLNSALCSVYPIATLSVHCFHDNICVVKC
jgi:hypothetical protein